MIFLFPFQSVKRDARIIIYGAGMSGQTYLRQVMMTKYCEIVCMIDRDAELYQMLPVRVATADFLGKLDYDAVVVANENEKTAKAIMRMLQEQYHVPCEKIVYDMQYIQPIEKIEGKMDDFPRLAVEEKGKHAIAIKMNGGFGDYIIAKNKIKEVAQWDENVIIDIFVESKMLAYAKVLFSDLPQIHGVIGNSGIYHAKKKDYLAAFLFTAALVIDSINEESLAEADLLREIIITVKEEVTKYYSRGLIPWAIHFARCEKDELNCYTSYNRYKEFNVKDVNVSIPMLDKFREPFRNLHLGEYVVFNYGADKPKNNDNVISAKVWPLEHYSQLAKLFKSRYPCIRLVQIGLRDTPKITGMDTYILGESIELIKYVLKNALLHVDCEGGMVHLATQLGTKCVVLFGPTPITYYAYRDNINILAETCSNCYWLSMDFYSCYRRLERPECMWSITPERVLKAIDSFFAQQ